MSYDSYKLQNPWDAGYLAETEYDYCTDCGDSFELSQLQDGLCYHCRMEVIKETHKQWVVKPERGVSGPVLAFLIVPEPAPEVEPLPKPTNVIVCGFKGCLVNEFKFITTTKHKVKKEHEKAIQDIEQGYGNGPDCNKKQGKKNNKPGSERKPSKSGVRQPDIQGLQAETVGFYDDGE